MFMYPMQPTDGDSHQQHVSGTYQDHGLIPQDIRNDHARPCGLNLCFSSSGCHWSLASDASCTDSPHVHFLHRIESHQDQSATHLDCHPCPLLCCHQVCNHPELVLEHVSRCGSLRNGEYRCPKHRAAERSASVGTARLLKCLHFPAQLCKRVNTKVHEKALLAGTKRVLQKLGSTRQRKSSLSSSPSRSSSTMPYELCEMSSSLTRSSLTMPDKLCEMSSSLTRSSSTMPEKLCEHGGTEFRPTPELHGIQLSELPAAESTYAELCAGWYPAELAADDPLATIPYGPSNNTSSLSGIEPPLSIAPGSENPVLGLDSPMTESDACGIISISLRLPAHHSGQHASPTADRSSTGVDPQQSYSDLVSPTSSGSPLSWASPNPFPSPQGDLRSSTINTSGALNPRRFSGHYSSRVVSPLNNDESACSTCGSTVTSPHGCAVFAPPADGYIADGRGSYSDYSAIPVSINSSLKRYPFLPGQSEESIAEKRSYLTLITNLPPRVNAENAYSMDGPLPNSLSLRGEDWPISYPSSGSSSNAGAHTQDGTPPDDRLVATPEKHHWNPISVDESLSTAHDTQLVDKTTSYTAPAPGLATDSSIATSIIAGTERRLSAGKLPTLFNVMCDLISGVEAHQSNITNGFHKAFVDATVLVFLTESDVLQDPQDTYVEYCMKLLRYLRCLLQGSLECQVVNDGLVVETTGQKCGRGGGAQRLVQRLDCHPDIVWVNSSPEYISPMDTLSPSSSLQTDSGYGTTSPRESAGLCSLPATPSTQGSARGTKRWRFDSTSPSPYRTPPDRHSRNPRVAASTSSRNPSQQDQVSSDYLNCPFPDCKARFKGISKHGPSNLRKHIRITHAKDPVIFQCPDSSCNSTFNRQYNLRSHWRTSHKDRTDAELGLPIVRQKRKKPGKAEKTAGDVMDVRH